MKHYITTKYLLICNKFEVLLVENKDDTPLKKVVSITIIINV